ncbi:MAG: TIGR02587 family membrane protein [Halomonas sp.]|nr:TIGR02587 family membrane protein [Halomonas sp.]
MKQSNQHFYTSLARAFGGAILFAFPVLMTMETWWLGFYVPRERIGLFLLVVLPILLGLAHISGYRYTSRWFEEVVDVFVATAVGLSTAALFLWIFGVIDQDTPLGHATGQVTLLSAPCAFGALLASEMLGKQSASNENRQQGIQGKYYRELGIMLAGALYGAFTVSPTAEMYLIAYKMSPWLLFGLAALSLVIMHGFVYGMSFRGEEQAEPNTSFLRTFFRYTVTGYALALGMSTYVLWTFERLQGLGFGTAIMLIIVLGFPAAIGAAASRLVL